MNEIMSQVLESILEILLPRIDGKLSIPGAKDAGVAKNLEGSTTLTPLECSLKTFDDLAVAKYGIHFHEADAQSQVKLLNENTGLWENFKRRFGPEFLRLYFENKNVLIAFGIEPRPPFPGGYVVEQVSSNHLKPVLARGKIYKETPRTINEANAFAK